MRHDFLLAVANIVFKYTIENADKEAYYRCIRCSFACGHARSSAANTKFVWNVLLFFFPLAGLRVSLALRDACALCTPIVHNQQTKKTQCSCTHAIAKRLATHTFRLTSRATRKCQKYNACTCAERTTARN